MKFSPWLIALAAVVLLAGWAWTGYNGLVTARGGVDLAWSQVETDYQRRFDLIPNLQRTVQGAADFEQQTFVQVTEARTQWLNAAGDRDARVEAANQFDSALSRLLVSVEAYPQLQATQAFRDFMTQIEGTENRISTSRRDYNQAVLAYNLKVRRFPGNLLAGLFGFDPAESFEAAEGADRAPVVDFSRSSAAASSASL